MAFYTPIDMTSSAATFQPNLTLRRVAVSSNTKLVVTKGIGFAARNSEAA